MQQICGYTFYSMITKPTNKWLVGLFILLIGFALYSSSLSNRHHKHTIEHYSHDVRDKWEASPDKHPHRMAHYGYVAFRQKYPLSFFDNGMDSYLGNAVFLEAHRQNNVNFSQASLSNGLLRFGELSGGLILQLLLPLLIFFWGFDLVAGERETGTLKLLLTQEATWTDIILGKSLGLFLVSLTILLPSLLVSAVLLLTETLISGNCESLVALGGLILSYLTYILIMSLLAVWISAISKSKKSALIKLIGFWLFFTLILPKIAQVAGQVIYPTPSKIAFETTVEEELVKQGDSHNPDDPHYKALKDSLLAAYNVTSPKELPFNYSGFIMKEGERLSTETYLRHQADLMNLYQKQSDLVNNTAIVNPYIAIKNISMVLSGTDFASYQAFNDYAETYRYNLAQTMNNLQIEHISNTTTTSADKGAVISQQYWKDFPDFEHEFLSFSEMSRNASFSFLSLFIWLIAFLLMANFSTKRLKAI